MALNKVLISTLVAALALLCTPFSYGDENPVAEEQTHVAGEKLDSGLGELPNYRFWTKYLVSRDKVDLAERIPGEKLDSGLGDLPPYREWAGYPGNRHLASAVSASRN